MLSLLNFAAVGLAALPQGYHPVVISGPFMGQNLEVLNENSFTVCNTKGEYEHVWFNLAGVQDFYCISQGLKLGGWDNENKVSKPKDNIKVRPFGYAGSDKDQLDGLAFGGGDIYPLVPRLETHGFRRGDSIFGHTYDWRLGVRDWEQQYYPTFKKIVEAAAEKNNGSPVILTGISMSGTYTHAFLSWAKREFGPQWAAKYVHAFVPVGAPFNGATMAVAAGIDSILGTWRTDGLCPSCDPPRVLPNMHQHDQRRRMDGLTDWMKDYATALGDDILQDVFASFPSLYLISPGYDHSTNPPTDPEVITIRNAITPAECTKDPKTATVCGAVEDASGYNFETGFLMQDQCGECYWTYDSCQAGFDRAHDGWTQDLCCKRHQCRPRTYRASELPELMRELGAEDKAQMMEYSLTIDTSSDPGVPVHCVYSHNVQTFTQLSMAANRNGAVEDLENNVITMDDGDQTVHLASLNVCDRWASTVKTYKIPGVAHSSMLSIEQVHDVIVGVATEDQASLNAWEEPEYSEVRPQELTVGVNVLLKRRQTAICDDVTQLNADDMFLDPNTNNMVKCIDADAYCLKNSCGDAADLRAFFKQSTTCCNRESKLGFNPKFWKLQHKAE